jgi:hypothetical protein
MSQRQSLATCSEPVSNVATLRAKCNTILMLQIERISDLRKTFTTFKKVTKITTLLTPFGLFALFLLSAVSLGSWALISWAFYTISPPLIFSPSLSLYGEIGARWMSYTLYGQIATIPFFLVYLYVFSHLIKDDMRKKRGISVTGWHWRGAEIEQKLMDQFTEYLSNEGLLNISALEQLIENLRDEISFDRRPSTRFWTLLTISVALSIGLLQPVFSQVLIMWVRSKEEIWQIAGLVIILSVSVVYLVFLTQLAYLPRRNQREIYLHSLSAIRLALLKSLKCEMSGSRSRPDRGVARSDDRHWISSLALCTACAFICGLRRRG